MKKTLMIFGAVFLAIVVFGGVFLGIAQYQRIENDASSKIYINENIPPIISSWSKDELLKRASPELKKTLDSENTDQMFAKLSKLGALKKYEIAKGASSIFFTTKYGKAISANYILNAKFQNSDAEIKIGLIQNKGEWQIVGFFVDSPLFD